MDAHFREYLAAIAGMSEIYGEPADDGPTDFHGDASMLAADPLAHQPAAATDTGVQVVVQA
jgi:hypothetical protein